VKRVKEWVRKDEEERNKREWVQPKWKVDVETPTHKAARELNYIEHALTYMPLIQVPQIINY